MCCVCLFTPVRVYTLNECKLSLSFRPSNTTKYFLSSSYKLFKQETDIRQRIFAFSPFSFFNIQRMQFAWKTWSYTAEHPNIQCNIFYYGDDATLTHTYIHSQEWKSLKFSQCSLMEKKNVKSRYLFRKNTFFCLSFSLRIVIDSFSNDPLPRINFVSWICFSSVIGLSLRCCFILPNYLCLRQRAPIFNW